MSDATSWAGDLWSSGGALFDSILAGLPDVPQHLHLEALKAHLPTPPSISDMQSFEFPSFSSFPQVPGLPELSQQFQTFHAKLPSLPRLPDLSLPPLPDVDISSAQEQLQAFYEDNSVAVTYFGLWTAIFIVVLALVSQLVSFMCLLCLLCRVSICFSSVTPRPCIYTLSVESGPISFGGRILYSL